MIIHIVTITAGLIVVGYIIWDFTKRYRAATGTSGEKILAAFDDIHTILVARITQLAGALATAIVGAAQTFDWQQFLALVQTALSDHPVWIAAAVFFLGGLVEWARRYKADDV